MPIDHAAAKAILDQEFSAAEVDFLGNKLAPEMSPEFVADCDTMFLSATQAYREALIGCLLARLQDRGINVSHPYSNHSPEAFNGRSLDEYVVNPFLQQHRIPSSKGPFLSVFRRSVKFELATRSGVRDKAGFDAFVRSVEHIKTLGTDHKLTAALRHLLMRFIELREASTIQLNKLIRFSSVQYGLLIAKLLQTSSGGRFPLFIVVSAFKAIKKHFKANWEISFQGINVADRASGAGGDLTISENGKTVLSAEITERTVDKSRVVSTFNTKIAPAGIEDYLFFVLPEPTAEARQMTQQYFAQGHEITFLNIQKWIVMILATIGQAGRAEFNASMLELLDSSDVPKALKVAWNNRVSEVVTHGHSSPD